MPQSRRTSKGPKPTPLAQTEQKNGAAGHSEDKFTKLAEIVDRHDDRLRLLFHLDKFVSLVYYDPNEAKGDQSDIFETWRLPRDLWQNQISVQESRAGRRQVQLLQAKFSDFLETQNDDADFETEPFVELPEKRKRSTKRPAKRPKRGETIAQLDEADLPSLNPVRGGAPAPKITHPVHMTFPNYSGDISALLGTYKSLDEEMDEEKYRNYMQQQVLMRRRVNAAKSSGLMEELQRLGAGEQRTKFVDPGLVPVHQDNLVAQAVYLGKHWQNFRKLKQANIRKNAQAVDQYFRRIAGAEEREKKDLDRLLRQQARRIANEIMKKWKLAERVVLQRKQSILDEENRVKGKNYLNRILEKSAQLLESRVESFAPEDDTESEGENNLISDSELTVEQLREKYRNLPDIESDPDQSAEDEIVDPDDQPSSPLNLPTPSDELLKLYNDVPSDSDEHGEDTDAGLESSDFESESSSGSGEEEGPGLASLFGSTAIEHDSDDESVKSDPDEDQLSGQAEGSADTSPATHEQGEVEARLVPRIESPNVLLRGILREYQRDGLDWLAGLYNTQTNGILADEMGLGKTIQTISLLCYLALEKHIWGPHLIVVPTSVMLNWEMEFKRFAPGFKVLTYYGNPQQRKDKRRGWNKDDTWHVCITSYQLVIQDQVAFRRKKWRYMILDEAHNIKNFRSQRWQALLNFNSERRLLLTGTPLQNNLIELWSLLYFLMPSSKGRQDMPDGFADLQNFQEWFARPVDQMVEEGEQADAEAKATIFKLHQVLRPYLLRRLKRDVEKQMPEKYEHVVYCRLSKRQRYLYDDFMSRASTKSTLASGNFLSILNCLMQLRKVCNHPDLFEVRPVVTSLAIDKSVPSYFAYTARKFSIKFDDGPDLDTMNLLFPAMESIPRWKALTVHQTRTNKELALELAELAPNTVMTEPDLQNIDQWVKYSLYRRRIERADRKRHQIYLNLFRTSRIPVYGEDLRKLVTVAPQPPRKGYNWAHLRVMDDLKMSLISREESVKPLITKFAFATPPVVTLDAAESAVAPLRSADDFELVRQSSAGHESQVRLSIAFPDKRLLQYDCGKLQLLAVLLRDLIADGHRALIFTQMTRVLDILEQFLNLHGWRYMRLDGATRVEQRQVLTERFNKDKNVPVFILSTRSGGLGINLTGADTVIFYDSDWNPAMDKQCQDRCHRIGQTREVHIYRLVSEYTIESNILRKATQKTVLDNVVIQDGDFTTDYLNRVTVQDLLGDDVGRETSSTTLKEIGNNIEALAQAEDADDRAAIKVAINEANLDQEEFEGRTPTPAVDRTSAEPEEEVEIGHIDDYMIRFIERGDFASAN